MDAKCQGKKTHAPAVDGTEDPRACRDFQWEGLAGLWEDLEDGEKGSQLEKQTCSSS